MTTWDIWAEGYRDNGGGGGATKLNVAPIEADTFDSAVEKHIASLPTAPDYLGGPTPASYYRHEGNAWRMWGCQLHANEAEARKSDAFYA